jgi:nucleotide-binding universal stress UspA family protein
MGQQHTVVVGIDVSTGSRAALRYAVEDAARRGTGVLVISALIPPQYWPDAYGLSAPPTIGELKADLRVIARRLVDHVVADRPDLAVVPVELHAIEGQPATVLIEQSRRADLLVVGHRGRGGFTSAVLGSVGLQCVLHAQCPVAVVRPEPEPSTTTDVAEDAAGRPAVAGPGYGGLLVGPLY